MFMYMFFPILILFISDFLPDSFPYMALQLVYQIVIVSLFPSLSYIIIEYKLNLHFVTTKICNELAMQIGTNIINYILLLLLLLYPWTHKENQVYRIYNRMIRRQCHCHSVIPYA